MELVWIGRPVSEDLEELDGFAEMMVTDTFRKEGLGHLLDDINGEIAGKRRAIREDLESRGLERTFLIARHRNLLIGTIEAAPVSSLILSGTDGAYTGMTEVCSVFVHPEYQGRGLGSLLWSAIGLVLLGKGAKAFCFDSGYASAQRKWINKFGQPDYCLKNYWGSGNDHMIWKRKTEQLPSRFCADFSGELPQIG